MYLLSTLPSKSKAYKNNATTSLNINSTVTYWDRNSADAGNMKGEHISLLLKDPVAKRNKRLS